MSDDVLEKCNETELLTLAHLQGLGNLRRGLPRELLIQIVSGEVRLEEKHLSESRETRKLLEKFIEKYWELIRSQLPGCNGKCTTFPCSEGRHALCFRGNREAIYL
jgi:hypothetical protein